MSVEFAVEDDLRQKLLSEPSNASWQPTAADFKVDSPRTVEDHLTLKAEEAEFYLNGRVSKLLQREKIATAVLADLRQNGIVYLPGDGVLVVEGKQHDGRRLDKVGIGDVFWKNNRFVGIWAIDHSLTDPYDYRVFDIPSKGVWDI
jgi:hypothetical protein